MYCWINKQWNHLWN